MRKSQSKTLCDRCAVNGFEVFEGLEGWGLDVWVVGHTSTSPVVLQK
jgi:hypothetical protein